MERNKLDVGSRSVIEAAYDDVIVSVGREGLGLQVGLIAMMIILVVQLRTHGANVIVEHLFLRTVVLVEVIVHITGLLAIDEVSVVVGGGNVHEENCFGIKLHLRRIKYKWQFAIIDHEDYQVIFPTVLFYARRAILREAIFVIDKLDTFGVGLRLRDSLRACSKGYPVTLGPKLHRERKPADDHFLFFTWFWL